jgi:hypothetical protein
MVEHKLLHLTISGYLLGSNFCRKNLQKGNVCIFVRKDQCSNKTDVSHHCNGQDLYTCAVQLETETATLFILCQDQIA